MANTNALDIAPIYSPEQIHVPPQLSDVLKAFTKEVVRTQPADLLQFSQEYFSNLASVAAAESQRKGFPTEEQIQQAYNKLGEHTGTSMESVVQLCTECGIDSSIVHDALTALDVQTGEHVQPLKVLALLVAMAHSDLSSACKALFNTLGNTTACLSQQQLKTLLGAITASDSSISPAMKDELASELSSNSPDPLSWPELYNTAAFQEIIKASDGNR